MSQNGQAHFKNLAATKIDSSMGGAQNRTTYHICILILMIPKFQSTLFKLSQNRNHGLA